MHILEWLRDSSGLPERGALGKKAKDAWYSQGEVLPSYTCRQIVPMATARLKCRQRGCELKHKTGPPPWASARRGSFLGSFQGLFLHLAETELCSHWPQRGPTPLYVGKEVEMKEIERGIEGHLGGSFGWALGSRFQLGSQSQGYGVSPHVKL